MSERSVDELVSAYVEDRDWEACREPVVKTSGIVREVASAILEAGSVGTQELTALYRLGMNNDTYPVSSKRGEVDELEIPDEVKQSVKNQVDEEVGTVGGLLFPVEVPAEKEAEVTECLDTLVSTAEREELNEAVRRFAEVDLPKVECGKISPILYYLHPEYFPVVNNMSRAGMVEYFDADISNSLQEYMDTAATYRSVRDEYGFEANLRDLDFFFVWVNQREQESSGPVVSTDRSYFWVNQGNQAEIRDGYVRAKADDGVWHHDLNQLGEGDVVFHNFDGELIGVSTVEKWSEQYSFRGETYQRVGVDFRAFDDAIDVNDDLKATLNDPEYQREYFPVNSNGNLKQAYLSQLSPEAAEFLLDEAEGWSQFRSLDSDRRSGGEVPDAPARAGEIERQLEAEKQVVMYGPPGTGKTYTAERFATWWVGQQDSSIPAGDRVETVTFHPSFTYEDFIEGLSAEATDEGQVSYEVQDGILKRVSQAANDAYEEAQATGEDAPRYVLVIDEINRGNLAQIFGETVTLLEADKRGSTTVRLAHSGSEFTLPPNLYVIGTMNTADRSIALVDAALRRRFRFIACPPEFELVTDHHDLPASPIADGSEFEALLGASIEVLETVNDRIVQSADLGKGKQIGHTRLFGVESVDELRDVWRYDILPLLEEYYFGQFDRIRHELFGEDVDELVDWEHKQIRNFSVQELGTALSRFVDEDVELTYSSNDQESSASRSRKQWDEELFFEEVESSFADEDVEVYRDLYDFGSMEADRVEYGTGKRTGAAQFYWDEYTDGKYLVYELRTNGALQFRFWGRKEYNVGPFESFLDQVNPLADDSVSVEYLLSDEFSGLEIRIERLRDAANREQVKDAIRRFVEDCTTATQ